VIAEGDLVALHVHAKTDKADRGRAIVVEHWDVIQDIPEKSVNQNTMF
jgi:predicted SnoaL-like aldol condensation-catalyzing enzyme